MYIEFKKKKKNCDKVVKIVEDLTESVCSWSHADMDSDYRERERDMRDMRQIWWGRGRRRRRLNQIKGKPKKDHEISVTLEDITISLSFSLSNSKIHQPLSFSIYSLFLYKKRPH